MAVCSLSNNGILGKDPSDYSRLEDDKNKKKLKRQSSLAKSLDDIFEEVKEKGLCNAIPTRFVVVFVAALANTISYIMRTNMSVTIVAMVNYTEHHCNETCPEAANSHNDDDHMNGEFHWDETLQGHILGSFYYGYIATNFNGGQLADYIGVRWLCGSVTLLSALLTLATPFVARFNVYALIALRIGTGLCQGVLTPAIYALLANWIPRSERALVLALIQVGGNLGAVFATVFAGLLCKYGFAGGWPSVFYVFGISGIVCFLLWMYTIYDSPDKHPRILKSELTMIKQTASASCTNVEKRKNIPWKAIWLSMPVWAISMAKFCGAWGNLMLMSKLPAYLNTMLHVSITENGYITSAVYIALSLSLTGFGFVSDWIGKKKYVSDTASRKIFETIALGGPAICLIMVPFVGCNLWELIALLNIALIIFGLNAGGDKPIVVDVAPDHSGTIYGITNAIASLPGILAPLVVGYLIGEFGHIKGWHLVFYSAAGVYIFGLFFFLIFGTAKAQPWGIIPPSRRPTAYTRQNSRKTPSRILSRQVSRTPRSFPSTPDPDRPESRGGGDLCIVDLNSDINKMLQKLGDRIEKSRCSTAERLPSIDELADDDRNGANVQFNNEIDVEICEEDVYIDEEEEREERLQYFRERRYSIFPIP